MFRNLLQSRTLKRLETSSKSLRCPGDSRTGDPMYMFATMTEHYISPLCHEGVSELFRTIKEGVCPSRIMYQSLSLLASTSRGQGSIGEVDSVKNDHQGVGPRLHNCSPSHKRPCKHSCMHSGRRVSALAGLGRIWSSLWMI